MQSDKCSGSATSYYLLWQNPRMWTFISWMQQVLPHWKFYKPLLIHVLDLNAWDKNVRLPAIQVAKGKVHLG